MKHLYVVNQVDCQPQWPNKTMPISYPWGKGFLAAGVLAVAFLAIVDLLSAAWLLGGGS
jgi:hypothetical protein